MYERLANNAKQDYEIVKDKTKLYHVPPKIKRPPNAFILFMQERAKQIVEEQLEHYQPPKSKPRKRNQKNKDKTKEADVTNQQPTILLNLKTGEEKGDISEQNSSSDFKSTNPSTITESAKSEVPLSELNFKVPDSKPPKIDRTQLTAILAEEWKNMSDSMKYVYQHAAKRLVILQIF